MVCKREVHADGRERRFGSKATADEVLKGLDLSDKTIVITGTTSGIGTETARSLATHGAHLVMVNRNRDAAEKLREQIYAQTNHRKIDLITCDLMSLKSVKEAADEIIEKGWPINVLILNAGVASPPVALSKDGFNSTFAVNHLAHFYFALLLKDRLISSAPSRIVVLASDLHRYTRIDSKLPLEKKLELLNPTPDTDMFSMTLYSRSKLSNVLFAFKLHREINKFGVNVNAVHPGAMIDTGLQRNGGILLTAFKKLITNRFTKTIQQGASTSVYVAVHPDLDKVSGHYFEGCWDDLSYLAKDLALDEQLQDALWERSVEMIKQTGLNI
ncbi:unnamed protein product [Bursaphelenchus xylophilus]|uniref:(pine wood nematode) hypothetical protein n=1 Tax=Bursaphelenchus xylophilus TaxID=6326 RepID=A0A1I7SS51_BURXY|nr:unnamed protein product [Bursaphelenchus xylophilus]CAG9105662.1 unnamed protein product [Bursaphelenchus xylophilus]